MLLQGVIYVLFHLCGSKLCTKLQLVILPSGIVIFIKVSVLGKGSNPVVVRLGVQKTCFLWGGFYKFQNIFTYLPISSSGI